MVWKKGKESLREAVRRLDSRLWHRLEEVWRLAEEGVQDAQRSRDGHQQGTPHCRAVEENLAALILDDWKGTQFTATDLFVLSAAAALHDAGKAGDSPDDHGHVSMWEVRDRAVTFGLDDGQAEVVGWIVRAHNDGDLEALPAGPEPLGVAEVSLRPLAALFKLADALHTDYRRVSRQVAELGDKQAEDNPKTRFRLRVRGWVFDDQGRIELYAVPKDWDDETVIYTGFEKTRQELEPVIPTLRDAGFPWELTLRLDEADLEREARREVEAEERVERAFVGMDYFTEADAPHFKGRDDDAMALWQRVMAVPVALLVGESGVGKTSLIHAGLFPLLHQARWRTAYIRPFDDPDRFVVRDLWRALPELESEPSTGVTIAEALARAGRAVGDHKLLVVLDQFEDVARVALPEMLDGVRRALLAVQAGRFRNLRLLVGYRADAEAVLGPLFQEVAGSDRGLPRTYLQPLSRAGARAALEAGFAQAQVGVSDRLLNAITDALEVQTSTAGIYPPYVQMVGETLCRAARDENESILTEELYRERGDCEGIIGRYLLQRLAEFGGREGAARRVLAALVRSTGVKGQRPSEELQAETGLGTERLARVLAELVDKRMLRHLGGGEYEIVHDHLALLVDQEIVSVREREFKELQEYLELKVRAYARHPVLLQPVDMARLYGVREQISPNDDQVRLLLHSCLSGQGPAWFWLRDAPKVKVESLLRDALGRPSPSLRLSAVSTLAQVVGRDAISDLWEVLKDEDWGVRQEAVQALAQVAGRDAIPNLRQMLKDENGRVRGAAAEALAQVAGQDEISDLREMLKDGDGDVRLAAVEVLAQVAGRGAIRDLREMLKDGDESVRGAAAEALAQVAGRDEISDLREMLKDSDWEVRGAAVRALAQVAGRDEIPDLQEMLKDGDESVRGAAVEALVQALQRLGRDAIPDLRGMLKGGDDDVRRAAAEVLAQALQRLGRDAIPDLREMLKDSDWEVRRVAAGALAQALQRLGQGEISDLREMLKDSDWEVRRAAAGALAHVAGRDAIPDLRGMLKGRDWTMRLAAVEALAQAAGRDAIPDLRGMLKDGDEHVRVAVVEVLAQVAGREEIPDLREMLKDGNRRVRRAAAEALAQALQRVGWDGIPDLREMLKDENRRVRWAAVKALGQVAGRDAIPDLREILKDRDRDVRQAAAEVLAQILQQRMGRDEIPDLQEILKDGNWRVRRAAVKALAQILQQMGRDAIPDLREMLKDEDGDVRQAAVRALQELVTENDLAWLVEWVIRYPLAQAGEQANHLLIHLDRRLYFPA